MYATRIINAIYIGTYVVLKWDRIYKIVQSQFLYTKAELEVKHICMHGELHVLNFLFMKPHAETIMCICIQS